MQKMQILFPDPVMAGLRAVAEAEDRPVSEIVRRAVDRHLAQLPAAEVLARKRAPAFPTFHAGPVLVSAGDLKAALYESGE